jgi:hypothetical protein
MSDFTQRLKESGGALVWMVPSLILHGLILGWLIFMIKPQLLGLANHDGSVESIEQAAALAVERHAELSTSKIDRARVEQVAAQIEATQTDEVRDKVSELLDTDAMLRDLEARKEQEFALLATELAAGAPQLANDALTMLVEAQTLVMQAQAEALSAAEQMTVARAELDAADGDTVKIEVATKALVEANSRTRAAQAKAKEAQTLITGVQTTVTQQLAFRNEKEFTAAREAQVVAASAQNEANTKQDAAAESANNLGGLRRQAEFTGKRLADGQGALDRASNRLHDQQAGLERARNNLEAENENVAKWERMLADANNQLSQAADERGKKIAGSAVIVAQKNLEKAKVGQGRQQTWVARAQEGIAKETVVKRKAEENLKTLTMAAQQALEAFHAAPAKTRELQVEARRAQEKALTLQNTASSAVAQATAGAGAPQVILANSGSSSASLPQPSLEGKTFAQLYHLAVQTEASIAARYQSIRATEVAVQRQIPLSEAKNYVGLALPNRPKYEGDPNTPANAQALRAKNTAIENAMTQLDSIVALTRNIAFQVNNAASTNKGVMLSLDDIKAGAIQSAELASLAGEKDDQQAVDLTDMMKAIESGGAWTGAGAPGVVMHGGEGEHGGPGGVESRGSGPQDGRGRDFGGFPGYGPGGIRGFPARGAVLESTPGRKVLGGDYQYGAKWMFVDSWYVIGPFPNPQRRNIDTKFPPETVVDLDASYQLENGAVLRWKFIRNSAAGVRPPDERPYAIYYAYTTLWMDQERGMWIATGSDDYSKIWINNILVWASGQMHKTWKANEGYRKVHFKKGLNHVLYRIENGQATCMWSLMLNMQPE